MRKLTGAQKRVIDNDDVAWVGWDAKNRPVVNAYYFAGFLQPRAKDRRNAEAKLKTWAIKKDGDPTEVLEPVTGIE